MLVKQTKKSCSYWTRRQNKCERCKKTLSAQGLRARGVKVMKNNWEQLRIFLWRAVTIILLHTSTIRYRSREDTICSHLNVDCGKPFQQKLRRCPLETLVCWWYRLQCIYWIWVIFMSDRKFFISDFHWFFGVNEDALYNSDESL